MTSISNWELERNGSQRDGNMRNGSKQDESTSGLSVFRVKTTEECICPICAGELIKKGIRTRFLTRTKPGATEDDYHPYEKICLLIQRHKCNSCGRIHHQLPDCIVPYKRFSAEIIESIIKQPEQATLIDEETVKRILAWWALMVAYILGVAPSLTQKHHVTIAPEHKLVQIVRALVNSHMWPGTRIGLNAAG